jgi:hypothetical protein
MNVRFALRACTSLGSSADSSRKAATFGSRSSSLSSIDIFASSAITSPLGVTTNGLISASDAPFSMNARYSWCMIFAAARAFCASG